MPEKYVYLDDLPVLVRHTGPTTRPDRVPETRQGQALVLIHGSGGNRLIFEPLVERLAETQSPLSFDLPGHGRSGGLDSLPTIEAMADLTHELIQQLEISRPVLVGFDMGCAVALECALRRPATASGLVLIAPSAGTGVPAALIDRYRRVCAGKEPRPFRAELFAPGTSPEVMRGWFMGELGTDPRATYGDLEALDAWRTNDRLGDLALPTCAISGSENPEDAEAADTLAGAIAGSQRISIEKAGHLIPVEQPDALAQQLGEFLAGLDR